jgi:GntR family transcriptional regulator
VTLLSDNVAADGAPPPALARDNPVPLHTRIREELRTQITRGVFAPRQRLDSEAQLMRRYGVSRITVRQALQALEQGGLIVKVAGKGSFVAPERPTQDLTQLQGLAEALAPQGLRILNRVLAQRPEVASETIAQRLGLATGDPLLHLRRLRLVDGAPLSVDTTWLPADVGQRVVQADLQRRDVFAILEQDLGLTLGHADLALDAVAADARLAAELEVPQGHPLLRIERTTHTAQGRPIDHEVLYCRADRFRWRLRLDRRTGEPQ